MPDPSVRVKYSSIPNPVSRLAVGVPDASSCTGVSPSYRNCVVVAPTVLLRGRSSPS